MSIFVEYTEPVWRGLNMRDLDVDEAYMILKSLGDITYYLYALSDECYMCPFSKVKAFGKHLENDETAIVESELDAIKIDVSRGVTYKVLYRDAGPYSYMNESSICQIYRNDLREFGVYNLTLHKNASCSIDIDKQGVDIYMSMLSVFVLTFLFLLLLKIGFCAFRLYRRHYQDAEERANNITVEMSTETLNSANQKRRMNSLDAFRGMAIILMIFVNSGGGHYWWIEHAVWNGLHLADVVFPSFLWIMGVCIPISVKSQLGRGMSKLQICRRILWRSIKLFAIGVCLNSVYGRPLENLRIMGVLQRFGLAFLVCGIVHTIFSQHAYILPQARGKRIFYDLIIFKGEFLVMFALIAIHLAIIFGLNVPGCFRGYLGPGGKHDNARYKNCTGGATGYIDLEILTDAHIYQHPTAKYVYGAQAFDPEGLFGTLLTIVQVFFGVLAGITILTYTDCRSRLIRWLNWAFVLGLFGALLCMFSKEEGVIPINKNLWSLSFVLVTTALAFLVLSVLYVIIDVKQLWRGFPFVECGMNAIILYVGHTIMHKMLPWHWSIGAMNTHFVLLLESTWNTLLWVAIAIYLDSIEFYYSL